MGLTWVWTMTRMTLRYCFMAAKSFYAASLAIGIAPPLTGLGESFCLLLCLGYAHRCSVGEGGGLHCPQPTKHRLMSALFPFPRGGTAGPWGPWAWFH